LNIQRKFRSRQDKFSNLLKLLLVLILAVGIFFRFFHLEQKVYWYDETYTSIPIAGYAKYSLKKEWLQLQTQHQGVVDVSLLQPYQFPSSQTNPVDTLVGVAEEPQNSPLYFLLARFWSQFLAVFAPAATPILATRSLSALLGVLVIPLAYWLAQELFASQRVGVIAASLIALSPLHLTYAQEARQYSLLTVLVLWSGITYLQALRLNTKPRWYLYSTSIALGLYSHLFFGWVAIAHVCHFVVMKLGELNSRRRGLKGLFSDALGKNALRAWVISVIAFAPWFVVVLLNLDAISSWRETPIGLGAVIGRWLLNLTRGFFEWETGAGNLFDLNFSLNNPILYLCLLTSALVVYAVFHLIRHTPKSAWLFVIMLAATTALPLVLPDLLKGGLRSTVPRYLIPCYLAVQLAIAFLIDWFSRQAKPHWRRWLGQLLWTSLIIGGIASCWISSQSLSGWSKYSGYYDPAIATIINATPNPLVISSNSVRLLSLSYSLNPNTKLQLNNGDLPVPIERYPASTFILDDSFEGSERLLNRLRKNYGDRLQLKFDQDMGFIHRSLRLWQLQSPSPPQ
jgi:uncharacterized membrane protein